jgi:hypothetical protein
MEKRCKVCNIRFFKKTKEGIKDWDARLFCSHECGWIGRRTVKGQIRSAESRNKMSIAKTGKYTKEKNPFYGRTHSDEAKKMLSENKKGKMTGSNHPNWKGGITSINRLLRTSYKYNEWRKAIYERDGYKCVHCGYDKGRILEADHIIPFSAIIEKLKFEQGIENLYDKAINYSLLWDINNGRTLCKPCHEKTETFAGRTSNHLIRFEHTA